MFFIKEEKDQSIRDNPVSCVNIFVCCFLSYKKPLQLKTTSNRRKLRKYRKVQENKNNL